jgi:magnesium transporter
VKVLTELAPAEVAALRERHEFFWLDLMGPEHEALTRLGEIFGLHPVVLEDLQHFGQRPKVDDYPEYLHAVFYGVEASQPVEVHLLIHGDALITVRRDHCTELLGAHRQVAAVDPDKEEYAVHRVLDALTDSFFPMLERLDEQIDALEDCIVDGSGADLLERIVDRKREVTGLRRLAVPQRDALARMVPLLGSLPGFTGDGSAEYFRDVDDHLLRIVDGLESGRDVLTGLLDVQLSAQSYRLNDYITRLTVLGAVFLPLTFITGFFGQNFGWMVDHVDGPGAFLGLGIGLEVIVVAAFVLWFRRSRQP